MKFQNATRPSLVFITPAVVMRVAAMDSAAAATMIGASAPKASITVKWT